MLGGNKYLFRALVVLLPLAGCSSEPSLAELNQHTMEAQARLDASTAKLAGIDGSIMWLQEHQAEDPAKMGRLIGRCQAQTGQQMEGAGAAAITECVKAAW